MHFWLTMGYVGLFRDSYCAGDTRRLGELPLDGQRLRSGEGGGNAWRLMQNRRMAKRTRRGFIAFGAGAVACVGGWEWLNSGAHAEGDIPPALRGVLGFNERVVRSALYSNDHLAKVYPASGCRKNQSERRISESMTISI